VTEKPKQGFATMSPERQRELASKGGRTVHERGLGHQWTSEEAKEMGRIGGRITAERRKRLKESQA
jgi:general stress protein YciG